MNCKHSSAVNTGFVSFHAFTCLDVLESVCEPIDFSLNRITVSDDLVEFFLRSFFLYKICIHSSTAALRCSGYFKKAFHSVPLMPKTLFALV